MKKVTGLFFFFIFTCYGIIEKGTYLNASLHIVLQKIGEDTIYDNSYIYYNKKTWYSCKFARLFASLCKCWLPASAGCLQVHVELQVCKHTANSPSVNLSAGLGGLLGSRSRCASISKPHCWTSGNAGKLVEASELLTLNRLAMGLSMLVTAGKTESVGL